MAKLITSDLIDDVVIVEPTIHADDRGYFIETYRREWFGLGREMVQGNRYYCTFSSAGLMRQGLCRQCTMSATAPLSRRN